MSYGFMARNDGGYVMIDGTYSNYAMCSKGTISTDTLKDNFSLKTITAAGLLNAPVVAVAATGGAWAEVYHYAGGTASIAIIARGGVGTSVNYYVFDRSHAPSGAGSYGLRIRNPSTKQVVFDSRDKHMRVVATVSGTPSDSTSPTVATLPSGKTYAVVQYAPMSQSRAVNQGGQSPPLWYQVALKACFSVSGGTIKCVNGEWNQAQWTGGGTPPEYVINGTGFILDVTNF